MRYYLVKIDQFIAGYDPIEIVHLLATEEPIHEEALNLLCDLWIDPYKKVYMNYVEFFNGDVRCELSHIKEIGSLTFNILKGVGL